MPDRCRGLPHGIDSCAMRVPSIDIVMPTFNRAPMLERAVESLVTQRYPTESYQVIVVDDGSTDETWKLLEGLASGCTNLKVFHMAHAGVAAARNKGWREGKGEVVMFTDDDCVADVGWIAAAAQALKFHPDALGVQGRTMTLPHLVTPLTHQIVVRRRNRLYQTCNIAYRREVLLTVGGFDEEVHHFHDTRLAAAVLSLGPIVFSREMVVIHPPRPRIFHTRDDWRQWLEDELRFCRRNPDFYQHTRGPNFLLGVTLHWLVGSTIKQAFTHIPWLLRDPVLYFRAMTLLARERATLLTMLPGFWREHKGRTADPQAIV